MRKLLLLLACLGICLSQSRAQEKSIKATPAKIQYVTPASKAAAADPSIQEVVNLQTKEVLYLKKKVDTETSTVSYDTLEYCSRSKRFIPIAPVKEVRSSCLRSKGVYSSQLIKAPVVNDKANVEFLKAQKAACSSASTKVKGQLRLVKKGGQ